MTARSLPITPPDVITQEFRTPRAVRRGVIAGVVGNMLEWYDFALFGFFAQQIGAHFFPEVARRLSRYAYLAEKPRRFHRHLDPSP